MSISKHLLLSASLISAAAVSFFVFRKRKRVIEDGEDLVLVKLLPLENIMYLRRDTPISTITWFHGDHNQAAAILKGRTLQILKKNPWLAGRLVKTRDGVYLSYHKNVDETSSFNPFFHMLDSPVHRHTPVEQMAKAAASLKLSNWSEESLWRVVVVPCKLEPSSRFAVVVSLSHILGGGRTFYSIHNMLCSTNDIVKLTVQRIETSEQQQKDALGQAEYNLTVSTPFMLNGMFGFLYSAFVAPLTGKHMEQAYIWGEKDDFKELKIDQAELGKVPFVSTHDILSTWFFQTTGCSFGLVTIDLLHGSRRLEGHTIHHAGNYWSLLFYQPPDFASPALIRKSLYTLKRVKTTSSMPSFWAILGATYAVTSNWVTFAAPNRIEGCREELHMPLHDYTEAGLPSSFSALIIFRATSDKIGILVTGVGPVLKRLERSLEQNAVPLHDYKKVPRY